MSHTCFTQNETKAAEYRAILRADLKELLLVTEKDYNDLNNVVWGRSARPISSLIRTPGENDCVTEEIVKWEEVDMSRTQLQRLRHQAQTMLFYLKITVAQQKLMLRHFDGNKTDTMRDFYEKYPAHTKKALIEKTCSEGRICVKTFRKWRNEYFINGGKFDPDNRGLEQFGWILVNEDKKLEFTNWLKCQKELSILVALDFVNVTLLAEFPIGRVSNWGRLKRPVVPSTVHRWMLYCNCTYEERTKSYLTDSHERHMTLLQRIWNCLLDYFLSLRMHRWVAFPQSVVDKLKSTHEDWPADSLAHTIPVEDVGKFPPGRLQHFSPTASISCSVLTLTLLLDSSS